MNNMYKLILTTLLLLPAGLSFANENEAHPRLFVGAAEIPQLRERLTTAPYRDMFEALRRQAEQKPYDPAEATGMYDMRIRHWAQMYLLSGEARYAEWSAEITRRFIRDPEFWNNPESKGLSRAAGLFSVAMAYDLCHDAWPEDLRRETSRELMESARELMRSMGAGANTRIGNNWQGVRYGSAGLAALACDEPGRLELAKETYTLMIRHLRANLSSGGWNPEGIGYMIYPTTFTAPFGIAAARASLGDLRKDVPAYPLSFWAALAGTVNIPQLHGRGLRADLADDHPGFKADGILGLSFYYGPENTHPALRWMYDYLVGERGDQSYDINEWGGGLYSILFYPSTLPAVRPDELLGRSFVDRASGVALFRDRFQDENDIVALVNATQRRADGGHAGPDVNTFRILGRGGFFVTGAGRTGDTAGQTNLFAGPPPRNGNNDLGKLLELDWDESKARGRAHLSGSSMGVLEHHRHFYVDYGEGNAADALFLNSDSSLNGKVWRLNTPEFNTVTLEGNAFVLTSPGGASLRVTVLEPANPGFRTGSVERGGGLNHSGFPYHGKKFANNTWIEFDVEGRAAVLMTLQRGEAPPVALQQALHGAEARVGQRRIAYEKESGRWYVDAEAETLAILERKTPLQARGLQAETLGDRSLALRWNRGALAAESLEVQRRKTKDDDFATVLRLPPDADSAVDGSVEPATEYDYRLVAVNAFGASSPSETASARTWSEGHVKRVEDFAGPGSLNRFGEWKFVNQDRGWDFSNEEGGSPRDATSARGFLSTGSVRINKNNIAYTEDFHADLSAPGAAILFDYRAQAVTTFYALLKLSDGRWVAGPGHMLPSNRQNWASTRVDIHSVEKWRLVDPAQVHLGDQVPLQAADFANICGIGIYASWPINQKWAQIDQLSVIGKPLP